MNNQNNLIYGKIIELAKQHEATHDDLDSFKDAELIEYQAIHIIVEYCETQGYLINGFPTEKRKLPKEELEEDYFCRERYQLYLDILATQHEDVAELMWSYVSCFWKEQYESKEEYLQNLRDNLNSEVFYNITI